MKRSERTQYKNINDTQKASIYRRKEGKKYKIALILLYINKKIGNCSHESKKIILDETDASKGTMKSIVMGSKVFSAIVKNDERNNALRVVVLETLFQRKPNPAPLITRF